MSEQRQRVEVEALIRHPVPTSGEDQCHLGRGVDMSIARQYKRIGFITGRTVTTKQLEEAVKVMEIFFPNMPQRVLIDTTRHAFRAAGLLIKGDDDE